MGPTWATFQHSGGTPVSGMRPQVALRPTMPHSAAGMRMEPPPSAPMLRGHRPAATTAPEPLELPPVMWPRFHGLRAAPWCGFNPMGLMPISFMFALPRMTAPAALRRAATVESAAATWLRNFVPSVVGKPARSTSSLRTTGTPSSTLSGRPARSRSVAASAARSTSSGLRATNSPIRSFPESSRSIASWMRRTTATGSTPPSR